MSRYIIMLVGLALLFGCNDNDVSPEQKQLNLNQSKWANANISDYAFRAARLCYCPVQESIIVTVSNNTVISGFFTPSGVMLDSDAISRTRTIEDYFALIQRGLDENFETLEVSYNNEFGFPESISIDESLQIADEEVVYLIRDFQ